MHILFLLYLLLWFWDFHIKNVQDFIKMCRARRFYSDFNTVFLLCLSCCLLLL